jgi:hypothetical protein
MKPIRLAFFFLLATSLGFCQNSFRTIKMPNGKGKLLKAVLTFKDDDKAVEIRPVKGDALTIPYGAIDKWAYEFTTERTVALTEGKTHWLEIDYHEQDVRKELVLQMQKQDYIRILDAIKKHTGVDVNLEGKVNKGR